MCLSIPSKVTEISDDRIMCTVDTMGVQREASLLMMQEEELHVGDYVLIHIGFVMEKIDEKEALDAMELYKELLTAMDEEERRQAILEGDQCAAY